MDDIHELAGQIFNAFGPWTGQPVAILGALSASLGRQRRWAGNYADG